MKASLVGVTRRSRAILTLVLGSGRGVTALAAGALATLVACGTVGFYSTGGEPPDGAGGGEVDGGSDDAPLTVGGPASGSVLSNAHIVPANATITVQGGQTATQAYRVLGIFDGAAEESDVTSRFVFWVPDNYLVGDFPTSGGPLFTTRLPTTPTDPLQRGGLLTVEAEALNPGDVAVTVTTGLTVQLLASLQDSSENGDGGALDAGLPADPASLFGGAGNPKRAPILEYPNDGAMLPPNLRLLDVHWMPGSTSNTLYQVTFASAVASITYYTRCTDLGGMLVAGACGLELDATGYGYLSQSNAGGGPVALTIEATDDEGTSVGTSSTFHVQFAQEPVNGAVYYWDVTNTQIMRFEFGGTSTTPDVFLAPGQYGTSAACIGCHTLSHDGTKMVASAGGELQGLLEYINDVAAPSTPLTATDDNVNRVQFASFSPLGDRFVAVYGDGAPASNLSLTPNNLWFHDGNTGVIVKDETKPLSFEPDHPSWSPDGTMIAMTHVGVHFTSQREYLGGIDVATFAAGAVTDGGVSVGDGGSELGDPVVVVPSNVTGATNAVNSYNPSFSPDSSFLLFSQTICPIAESQTYFCDSDVEDNPNATTWAVTPAAGATPLHLDNAGAHGVADRAANAILDTFPRSTPFETEQGAGKLFWFTIASVRKPGLRIDDYQVNQQQLWMFAVDPAKILAGEDGSFTAFFLPFQDATTSNHIAQWAASPSSAPPPPPPTPPTPPAPPSLPTTPGTTQ